MSYQEYDSKKSSLKKDINKSSLRGSSQLVSDFRETGFENEDIVEQSFKRIMDAREATKRSTDHIKKGYFISLLLTILIGAIQLGWMIGIWNAIFNPWVIYMDKQNENCGGVYLQYPKCDHKNFDSEHNNYHVNPDKSFWSQTIMAITMVGCMIGALFCGPIAFIGRWNILIICNVLILVSQAVSCVPILIQNIYVFIAAKFIFGVACGAISFICPKFVTETAPKEYTGSAGAMFQVFICFGIAVANLLPAAYPANGAILDDNNAEWILMWTCFTPIALAIIQTLLMVTVFRFDTPKFMKEKGQTTKLRETLMKIYDERAIQEVIDDIQVANDISGILDDAEEVDGNSYKDVCCNPIFSQATWLGCALAMFQQLSGVNILFMYSSTVLKKVGNSILISLIINVPNFVFTIPGMFAIQKVGRKTLMIVGGFGMTIGMYGLGVGMLEDQMYVSIAAILIFVISFEFSWGPIVWLYNAEIMKDKANSLATVLNWVANLTITIVAPTIKQNLDDEQAGFIFFGTGSIMLVATIYTIIYMKETKGKLPAEIEEIFNKTKTAEEKHLLSNKKGYNKVGEEDIM